MKKNIEKEYNDLMQSQTISDKNRSNLEKIRKMQQAGILKKPSYNDVRFNHKII